MWPLACLRCTAIFGVEPIDVIVEAAALEAAALAAEAAAAGAVELGGVVGAAETPTTASTQAAPHFVPKSPYALPEDCPVAGPSGLGNRTFVKGFPSSPFDWSSLVFARKWSNPPEGETASYACKNGERQAHQRV